MKRLLVLGFLLLLPGGTGPTVKEETLRFSRFGTVHVYRDAPHPSHVVLFVSGDGGWKLGVVDMAQALAAQDALVVGVDLPHYMQQLEGGSQPCSYPAADFEALSKFVQKTLDFPVYIPPVLIGYSSGATLVYATLVQAPPTTFRGAISLGFCPDLPLRKPFCRGSGLEWEPGPKGKGVSFLPAANLEAPWVALQGTIDQVCAPTATEAYVKQVRNGEIVLLPKVGHGYSVPKNWMPQFQQAFARVVTHAEVAPRAVVPELPDLPLIEVPAAAKGGKLLAVMITGDGGWGVTDRGLGQTLAEKGIPVVALNSLHYFWTPRTPEGAASDLARLLQHYLAAWNKDEVILIGYSFGADVLPFLVNRLPGDLRSRVRVIALLGPSQSASFAFHLTHWLGSFQHEDSLPVRPEVDKLKGKTLLCFYGAAESDSLCPELGPGQAKVFAHEGGHRVGREFDPIADAILVEAH